MKTLLSPVHTHCPAAPSLTLPVGNVSSHPPSSRKRSQAEPRGCPRAPQTLVRAAGRMSTDRCPPGTLAVRAGVLSPPFAQGPPKKQPPLFSQQPEICLLSLWISFHFLEFYIINRIMLIHLWCCVYKYFIPLYCRLVFHCMDMSKFVYRFSY